MLFVWDHNELFAVTSDCNVVVGCGIEVPFFGVAQDVFNLGGIKSPQSQAILHVMCPFNLHPSLS